MKKFQCGFKSANLTRATQTEHLPIPSLLFYPSPFFWIGVSLREACEAVIMHTLPKNTGGVIAVAPLKAENLGVEANESQGDSGSESGAEIIMMFNSLG